MSLEKVTIFDAYEAIGGQSHVRGGKGSIDVLCPLHLERSPSCTLTGHNDTWYCHQEGVGGSAVELVRLAQYPKLESKEGYRAAYLFLEALAGGSTPPPFKRFDGESDALRPYSPNTPLRDQRKLQYTFVDHNGKPVYDEIRTEGVDETTGELTKRIRLRRRLPPGRWLQSGDKWRYYDQGGNALSYGPLDPAPIERPRHYQDGSPAPEPFGTYLYGGGALRGVPRYFYRFPTVLATAAAGGTIVVLEGPKKADALARRTDLCSTTLAGGVDGALGPELAIFMSGAGGALVLADSEIVGRNCAIKRAKTISEYVPDVRVVDFFGDDSGRDVMEWLDGLGRTNGEGVREQLQAIADRTMRVTPEGCDLPDAPFPALTPLRALQRTRTAAQRHR